MIQLENYYTKNGYNHLIVWRDETHCITKLTIPCSGAFVCYEAFEIIVRPKGEYFGKHYEAQELTPSNEQWGAKGYTTHTLEEAHKKINQLKIKQNGKKHRNPKNNLQTI